MIKVGRDNYLILNLQGFSKALLLHQRKTLFHPGDYIDIRKHAKFDKQVEGTRLKRSTPA